MSLLVDLAGCPERWTRQQFALSGKPFSISGQGRIGDQMHIQFLQMLSRLLLDVLHALLRHGAEGDVPVDVRAGLLGPELEILPHAVGHGLQVLGQEVAFVLCVELGRVPALGDVVHLP